MPFEAAASYSAISAQLSHELALLYNRQLELEAEHAAKIVEVNEKFLSSIGWSNDKSRLHLENGNDTEHIRASLLKTTSIRAVIEQSEQSIQAATLKLNTAKQANETVVRPFLESSMELINTSRVHAEMGTEQIKRLRDAHDTVKKARTEYETAKAMASELSEGGASFSATTTIRKKDAEKKIMLKVMERDMKTSFALKEAETIQVRIAKNLYTVQLPALFEDMRLLDKNRLDLLKTTASSLNNLEKVKLEFSNNSSTKITDRIDSINVEDDAEYGFEMFASIDKEESITVKSITNAVFAGAMGIKRGDQSQGWLKQHFVLSSDRNLYCFDHIDAQNVREVIELSKFQVYSVDNSYFKRPNCFQLMFDGSKIEGLNNNNRITYNFLTESPEAKRGWLQKLRKYCFCCQKCAALYDYEPIKSAPDAQQQQIDSTASPARRFISLWVMEAKDISQITTNKQASTYCAVLLDNVKQARTTSKGGESVFWGEEFKFDDVSPCQSRLSIVLFGSNKNDTYLELGCVSIKMNDIQPSNRVEDWFTIIPFTKSNQPQEAMSTIRIACLLSVEQKLSPMLQSKFLNVIKSPPYACIKYADKFLGSKREEFAKVFINVMIDSDNELDAIKELVTDEINQADNPKILFRGNSMATKALDVYMKIIGSEYLYETLHSLVEIIYASDENLEVDPARLAKQKLSNDQKDKLIKKNLGRLLMNVEAITYAIFKSVEKLPNGMREVFIHIKDSVSAKFSDDQTKYIGISGFIFLRLFCPAILSPKLFGLMREHPNENTGRMLTLIAKILQSLANLVQFEGKEAHMEACNSFIDSKITNMKAFLDQISSPIGNGVAKLRKKPLVDIRHESAILATMFNEYYSELSAENQANPEESIEKLLPILAEVRSELSIEERDTSNSTPILDRARHHSMDSRSSHGSNKLTPENTKMALKFDQQHARILEEIGRSDSVEVENAAFQGFAIPTADSSTALSPVSRDSASRESSVSIAPAAVSKTAMAATAQQSLNNVSASSSVNTIAMKRQPFSYLQSSTSVENLKDLASGIAGGGISYGVESMLSGAIPVGNKDYRDKLLESEKNGVSSQITMKMKLKSIFSSDHSHSSGGEQQSSVSSTTTASADSPRAHRAKGIGGMTLRVRANNPTPNEDALKVQARDRTVSQETEVIRIGSNLSKNHSDSNIMNKLAEEEERELDRQPLDFDFSSAAAAAQGSDDVKPQNEGEVLPASSSFNPSSMLMDLPDDQSSPYYKDAVEPVSSVKGNFKSLFSQGGEGNDPSYSVPLSSRGEIARRIMKSGNKDRKSAIFSASANELANLADKNGSSKSPSAVMSNDAIVDFLSTNDLENTNSNTTTAAGSSTTKRGFFKNLIKGSKTATSNTAGTFFSVSSDQLYTTSPETATSPMSNSSGNDGGKSKNKFSFSTITRRSKKNNFASNDELKGISLGSSSSMELLNQDQGGDEKSEISSIPRNKNKNPKRMSADSSQVTTSTMSKTSKKNLFSSSLPASNILSTEDENEGLERTAGGGAFGSSLGSGGFLANHD